MQLVLGARMESSLGAAGAAPPERWRLGERGKRALRRVAWALAFALVALLGALHGATLAIGAEGVSDLASAGPGSARAARAGKELRGSFWKPEHSDAARPPAEIAPRRWRPEQSH